MANTGEQSGTYEVKLKVDNVVVTSKSVTVAGKSNQTVSFTTSKDKAGTYSVSVDALTGSFTVKPAAVIPPPPPKTNWGLIIGVIVGVVVVAAVVAVVLVRRKKK